MPEGERAGGVYVEISADGTPLVQGIGKSVAAAREGGQQIAAGLNTATVAANETTASIVRVGRAAEGSVSQIAAMSGAVRVLSGEQSIRAIERLGVSILGLGEAAQAAFPLIGAIAVGELITRVYERFTKVSESEREASEEAKRFADEIETANRRAEELDATIARFRDGTVAGLKVSLDNAVGDVAAKVNALQAAEEKLRGAQTVAGVGASGVAALSHGASSVTMTPEVAAAHKAESDLNVALKEVDAAKAALDQARNEEAKKAAKEAADDQARIHEEFIEAQRDFERREAEEARRAEEQARRVQQARKKILEDQLHDLEFTGSQMDAMLRKREQSDREAATEANRNENLRLRTGALGIQQAGDQIEASTAQEKLEAELAYGAALTHTKQEQIDYLERIQALEEKEFQTKIGIAQLELLQATLDNSQVPTAEGQLKIAQDRLAVEKAIAALNGKRIQDEIALQAAQQKGSLRSTLAQQGARIPQALGSSLASGIIDGKSIGKDIRQSLSGIGKEMLGSVFDKLITQIATQTGVTAALNAIMGVHTGVTTANTAATLGQTLSTIANTVSTDLNTFWLAIKSFFGFADGTDSAPGGLSLVGERGPELMNVPRGAQIIPNVPTMSLLSGLGNTSSFVSSHTSHSVSIGELHLHGMQNAETFARNLPRVLKTRAPNFSPATR